MLNQKKLEDRLLSLEAAAKVMVREIDGIRSMFEVKEKPAEVNITAINLRKRRLRSLKKALQ